MLVLTRKRGQRILIGKDIVIELRGLAPGRARIAISAPPNTAVVREELTVQPHKAEAAK